RIRRLALAVMRGLQDHGMAATPKHFPGDGFDDRDQHVCTTINPLAIDDWFEISGRLFQDAIDADAWTMMMGHISLPSWDAGAGAHWRDAPPATLSRKLMIDLLRERMGFQGLILSDAMNMGGVLSRMSYGDARVAAVANGCDMLLFNNDAEDFELLKAGVEDGRISEERLDDAVRRILALKQCVGLAEDSAPPEPVTDGERAGYDAAALRLAEASVTVVRDEDGVLPLQLAPGSKVLSFHGRHFPQFNVDSFDERLRALGCEVDHIDEGNIPWELPDRHAIRAYDVVLLHFVVDPAWGSNSIRAAGSMARCAYYLQGTHHPRMVMVSWGSPYHGYEFPHFPALINAYGYVPVLQDTVLGILRGEITATGTSPVDLEAPYRHQQQMAQWRPANH
ncbi:MAG: glycoside hydrolase family 3 protein, partial [Planctomycetota bacterium]